MEVPMIKGVIFDLDGVLVSTDKLHFLAWQKLARELGIETFTEEDNIRQRGVSRMESLEVVLEKSDQSFTLEQKEALAEKKNDYYKEMLESLGEEAVLKDAKEALLMLRDKNIRIGVGSVSKNALVILERTRLLPLIDKVSCGLDITKSKPDPEVFIVAADKLELPYEACMVVEDSAAGIAAAKATHMRTLGVGPDYMTLDSDFHSKTLLSDVNWEEILN
jgi:beta-phosphoglucomutase